MGEHSFRPQLAGPLYRQVAELLRRRIEDLEWRPDIAMPNEALLARQMGVSIGTMRKALEALEQQKYITRRQGRGTYVVDASFEAELDRFAHIYRVDLRRGAESYAVRCCKRPAARSEVVALGLADGKQVIEIRRARRQHGAYATSERLVVPATPFDGLDEIDNLSEPLLFAVYRRDFHVVVTAVSETIVPWNADAELARQLGIEPGKAVLRITRSSSSACGQAIELSVRHVHVHPAADDDAYCNDEAQLALSQSRPQISSDAGVIARGMG